MLICSLKALQGPITFRILCELSVCSLRALRGRITFQMLEEFSGNSDSYIRSCPPGSESVGIFAIKADGTGGCRDMTTTSDAAIDDKFGIANILRLQCFAWTVFLSTTCVC